MKVCKIVCCKDIQYIRHRLYPPPAPPSVSGFCLLLSEFIPQKLSINIWNGVTRTRWEFKFEILDVWLFQGLNNSRTLPTENIQLLLDNLATYMNSISLESSATMWTNILNQFDTFFRRLTEILPVPCDMTSVMKIITSLLKVNGINNAKVFLTY